MVNWDKFRLSGEDNYWKDFYRDTSEDRLFSAVGKVAKFSVKE